MAKSVARRLNFIYYSKISVKSNKPSSKPSKPTVSTYQAKQASFRCEKFQASKLRLFGLACLLNSKSVRSGLSFANRAVFYAENLLNYSIQAKEGIPPLPIGPNHKFAHIALGVSEKTIAHMNDKKSTS